MKSRLVVSIVISILIASALAASYMGYTTVLASSTHNFTLTLTGTAYDPQRHMYVNVALSLTGTVDGNLKKVMELNVKGGDLSVDNYGTFSVSQGSGEMVSSCHYVSLCKHLTPRYGGKVSCWCMRGKTGPCSGQRLQFSLFASNVILPMAGCPRLDSLSLSGTITPVY